MNSEEKLSQIEDQIHVIARQHHGIRAPGALAFDFVSWFYLIQFVASVRDSFPSLDVRFTRTSLRVKVEVV